MLVPVEFQLIFKNLEDLQVDRIAQDTYYSRYLERCGGEADADEAEAELSNRNGPAPADSARAGILIDFVIGHHSMSFIYLIHLSSSISLTHPGCHDIDVLIKAVSTSLLESQEGRLDRLD